MLVKGDTGKDSPGNGVGGGCVCVYVCVGAGVPQATVMEAKP